MLSISLKAKRRLGRSGIATLPSWAFLRTSRCRGGSGSGMSMSELPTCQRRVGWGESALVRLRLEGTHGLRFKLSGNDFGRMGGEAC